MLLVNAAEEVLREEIVGLVKPRDTELELSDIAPEIPSPSEDIVTSSSVSRGRSNGFVSPFESSSGDPICRANGRKVFGLTCGDVNNPLPSIPLVSK